MRHESKVTEFDVIFWTCIVDMGKEAITMALEDAGLVYHDVQAVVASYCYGEPTCGQRVAYGRRHHLLYIL